MPAARCAEPTGRRTRAAGVAVTALGCLVLAGCTGQSTTSTAAPGPASAEAASYSVQLCSEAAEYQAAADGITGVDLSSAGTDAVKQSVLELQTATNNLIAVAAAEKQFTPQLAELETASTALNATTSGNASIDVGEVTTSVTAVEQAAQPIMDSLRAGCPSLPG